jgi:UDP-GlcNAc:undecaprenyl-phosphate GlcNAc-1-phosphate transferase
MFSNELIDVYKRLLTIGGFSLLASLFLTPIIGYLAVKYKFIDLPASKRKRTDKSLAQRIHENTKPRLGGVAYLVPVMIIMLTQTTVNSQVIGMTIGLCILLVIGSLDDKYELRAKTQLLSQLIAAIIVVMLGVKILNIDFAGMNFNFEWWKASFDILSTTISFVFPADIITIIWILGVINAVNWMYGMDSIGEAMTVIAAITTGLLSIRAGLYDYALVSFSLAGGILGFLPFNFYPSKIIGGTAGATGNGFLLAVLAIMSGAKFSNAIILLLFPIFDMIWVVIYRLNKHKDQPFLARPFISGKVHFHHRLMILGLTQRQILLVETVIITAISALGVYMSGFSANFLFLVISVSVLLIVFAMVGVFVKRKEGKIVEEIVKSNNTLERNPVRRSDDEIPPEERFAY